MKRFNMLFMSAKYFPDYSFTKKVSYRAPPLPWCLVSHSEWTTVEKSSVGLLYIVYLYTSILYRLDLSTPHSSPVSKSVTLSRSETLNTASSDSSNSLSCTRVFTVCQCRLTRVLEITD